MNTPEGKSEKIPEWSIFDRLDELENITLELMETTEKTVPTLEEVAKSATNAHLMAGYGIWMAFLLACKEAVDTRAVKNMILKHLRKLGISEEPLQWLEGSLDNACKSLDERKSRR